jgi:multidrug transporter EmrE-like cation transporter
MSSLLANPAKLTLLTFALFLANFIFNVVSNASFKYSAQSPNWNGIIAWQVVGNLAGFITVITLTLLLRNTPLNIAFPVTAGLSVVGVQVFAAWLLFHEPISPIKWLGTVLIVVGIILIGTQSK